MIGVYPNMWNQQHFQISLFTSHNQHATAAGRCYEATKIHSACRCEHNCCGNDIWWRGFPIQNRGQVFSLDPKHRNRLEPHKRPFHTIIPAFLTRDGQPVMSFGVMGGDFQPQGHAQVVMNTLDFGMSPQQAGDQPRIAHSGSSGPWGAKSRDGGSLTLEHGIDRCRSTVQSQSLEPESDSHPELSTIGCGHADSPVRPQRLQESQFRPHAPSSIACLV